MIYAIQNYTLEQTINLIQLMGDIGFLKDKENIPKLKFAAEFFLEKVIESKEPLPLIDRLVYVCKGYKESIQEEVVGTVIQLVKDLQTEHFTTPAVTKKLLGFYRKIKAQSTLAAFAPLTKAITEKIIQDMSSREYPHPEWISATNFCYLTFTDPQYVQTETILTNNNCILLAKEFFYAYKNTGNEGYQEIAKKAFQKLPPKQLYESDLVCFVDMLRRGSKEEKRKAKELLEIQEYDISNMKSMKIMLYVDILYKDENNPQKALEYIQAVSPTSIYIDVLECLYLELYYLFKITPLSIDSIKSRIEKLDEGSFFRFYYSYLLDLQEDKTRMPTAEALEKFIFMAYSVRSYDEFCSNALNILAIRLLKELLTEVQKLVYKDSEKW
jgi:hypothetical protein